MPLSHSGEAFSKLCILLGKLGYGEQDYPDRSPPQHTGSVQAWAVSQFYGSNLPSLPFQTPSTTLWVSLGKQSG